jgi:hypothetical protein
VRLIGGDAHDGRDVVELGRAHEVLALARLQRAVLAVEDQEVPTEVGHELDQRGIGIADEAAEDCLALAQGALCQVVAHRSARISGIGGSGAAWRVVWLPALSGE